MMIEIENKIVSTEIFKEAFCCDLNACKGACCIEGDAGAPLEKEEVNIIKSILPQIKPYMTKKGLKTLEEKGFSEIDTDGENVTTLNNGKECLFTNFNEQGKAFCAIEQAYRDGKINYIKPISCHLYPIRIMAYDKFDALTYHKWKICAPACELGSKLKVKVFQFLKEPLVRKYGESFYSEMENAAIEVDQHGF